MKKSILTNLLLFIKGAAIGGCMIVPGMSAGTVIILCGLYGALIGHINGLFKSKKHFIDAVIFFIPLALGAVVGIAALSRGLEFLIEKFSLPVFALFAGLVLGSAPLVLGITYAKPETEKETPTKFRWWHLIPFGVACALVIIFALFTPPDTETKTLTATTGIMLVVAGAMTTAAMIIPGISGAFLLILIGYYSTVLNAVNTFNIPVLALFVLGAPIGLIVSAKGIGFLLKRFKIISHMAIVGFLIGSVVGIFIYDGTYASATNAWGITASIVLFIVGFALVLLLSRSTKNKRDIL
jgi:putative membrane protein